MVASVGSMRIDATSTSCAVEPLVPPLVPPMVPLVPPLVVWLSTPLPPKVLPSEPLPQATGRKAARPTEASRPRVVRRWKITKLTDSVQASWSLECPFCERFSVVAGMCPRCA
jgi:hypothetical protein